MRVELQLFMERSDLKDPGSIEDDGEEDTGQGIVACQVLSS